MGAVGSAYDNAMMESFWGRMQVELLNRQRWKTRIELATAIHDYIELWHNTRRRHSALGMLTPSEIEDLWLNAIDEPGSAKTAPCVSVDERLAAGLSDTRVDPDHQHHLKTNTSKAA
jgi:hypothetical protein